MTNKELYSKTSLIKLEQCNKAFYLYKKHPYLKDKLSVDKQLTFKRGHAIGSLAHKLFPGGIDVSQATKNSAEAIKFTQELIDKKTPIIYEGTFTFNKILVMVDILVLTQNGYEAFEVKSSLKISDVYIKDACLQYYVLKHCLLNLNDFFIVVVNSDYILDGELNVKNYFKRKSIKQFGEKNLKYFTELAGNADLIIEKNAIPNIAIGIHCFKPYQCDYFGTCWKEIDFEKSVLSLPFVSKEKLFEIYNNGTKNIADVVETDFEKAAVVKVAKSIKNNTEFIDLAEIENFLNLVTTNFCTLDIEVIASALPFVQGTKPFEQLPFLCCIYDGSNYKKVFKAYTTTTDDRFEFANELIDVTKNFDSILVFDKTMEVITIKRLAELFPDLKNDLLNITTKFIDAFDVIHNFSYYNPLFKGNLNLKAISAVLNLNVSYSSIQSGLHAMQVFEEFRASDDLINKEQLQSELIAYCNSDAKAVYEFYMFLKSKAN